MPKVITSISSTIGVTFLFPFLSFLIGQQKKKDLFDFHSLGPGFGAVIKHTVSRCTQSQPLILNRTV